MFGVSRVWLIGVAAAGVLAGAAFGIGSAGASGGTSSTRTTAAWPPVPASLARRLAHLPAQVQRRVKRAQARIDQLRGRIAHLGIAGPPVHETEVVPSSSGGFETVTIDSGTLKSMSGTTLTIDEGWGGHTYKTVSLSLPSGTSVTRDLQAASLSDLKAGDRVTVTQRPGGDSVTAWDSQGVPGIGFGGRLPIPPGP